jgi:ketosteroid isomerase-like protein
MSDCGGAGGLKNLLETEYAFAEQARAGVRAAFLEYLADDALVLQPNPVPGRAAYLAAKENADSLQWYPAAAAVADSDDLGFTAGPWIYTAAAGGGRQLQGHFVTVWKRDALCRWRVEFDGGVSHPAPASAEQKLALDPAPAPAASPPPSSFVAEDAPAHAMLEFQATCREDGFAAALRTYARTADFRFFTDGELPMGVADANRYLTGHALPGGVWKQSAGSRSADSTLVYSVGELVGANAHSSHAYVQIWQYDRRVANWGLRILLVNPLAGVSK